MSGQNNDAESTIKKWSARVDLTSRDLQAGTVQLPGRLQDLPPPGTLEAFDSESAADYLLELHEPRALRGLSEFFADQGLKPNDTIMLSLQGNRLTLEAVKRKRRHQQKRKLESTPTSQAAAPQLVFSAESTSLEDIGAITTPEAEFPEGVELGNSSFEPDYREPSLETVSEPVVPEPVAEPSESANDAFSEFAEAGDLDAFDDLDELEGLEFKESPDLSAAPEIQPSADDTSQEPAELPEATQLEVEPPVMVEPESEPSGSAEADPPETESQQSTEPLSVVSSVGSPAFHTLPRRPFRSQAPTDPGTRHEPSGPVIMPAPPMAMSRQEQVPEEPASNVPAAGGNAVERLEAYLAGPTIPAIIQVTKLAAELQLDAAELADALRAKAAEPQSRLSNIRPDYYLYKRPTD